MTRKEEIVKIAHEFYKGDEVSTFVTAAQWADKTMIDKACEWLEEKNKMYMYELEMILGKQFINDFKKAMEE